MGSGHSNTGTEPLQKRYCSNCKKVTSFQGKGYCYDCGKYNDILIPPRDDSASYVG